MGRGPAEGPYYWDESVGRYRGPGGLFVGFEAMQEVMQARIDAGFSALDDMLTALLDGEIDIDQWQRAVALEVRRAHTQLAALGRGGWSRMSPADWGRVGQQVRFELAHLRDFARDLAAGRLSEAQARMRLNMYADHIWTSYWGGQTSAKEQAGAAFESRHTSSAESCDDCRRYEAMGIVPLRSLPEPGQRSRCGARCKCSKRYYDAKQRPL
jgi:hypothetical protein